MRVTLCLAMFALVCGCDMSGQEEEVSSSAVEPVMEAATSAKTGAAKKPTFSTRKDVVPSRPIPFRWVEQEEPSEDALFVYGALLRASTNHEGTHYTRVIIDEKETLRARGKHDWSVISPGEFTQESVLGVDHKNGRLLVVSFSQTSPEVGLRAYDLTTGKLHYHTRLSNHAPASHGTYRHEVQARVVGKEEVHIYRNTNFGQFAESVSLLDGRILGSHKVEESVVALDPLRSSSGTFRRATGHEVAGRGDGEDHSFHVQKVVREEYIQLKELVVSRKSLTGDTVWSQTVVMKGDVRGINATSDAVTVLTHEPSGFTGKEQLRAFDPETGQLLWTQASSCSGLPSILTGIRAPCELHQGKHVATLMSAHAMSLFTVYHPKNGEVIYEYWKG